MFDACSVCSLSDVLMNVWIKVCESRKATFRSVAIVGVS